MKKYFFRPPNRILMGPGPSNVHPQVLEAMASPTIGHLDPSFIDLMDDIKSQLRDTFLTENDVTFPVSGPGSAGMETAVVNMVEPGMKVIVCVNGAFGARIKEMVERHGGTAIVVDAPWGTPVDPRKLENTLAQNRDAKLVAFVHAETSTGARSDVRELARISHKYDCLTIVDTVTSLGGIPVKVDEWELDVVYSGSQKCLSCPPGLSPITFNDRAIEAVKNRKTKVQSWFMDVGLILSYWSGANRTYHHTAPVNALYGLHEALGLLHKEGLDKAWERHERNSEIFRAGLEKLGLKTLVNDAASLPELIAVVVPDGVDEAAVRNHLLDNYDIEIGAGLGQLAGKIWRIGLMGYTSNEKNVGLCLKALEDALSKS
ncbi:MAG TPA: alanine--glyoxylate aminotransferase family protein [Candidatus Acidoferrales bacterium]|nr:alanine--glyoxylate aminotransferase family protein [Candidatus Acidoferrales bacterium]